MNKIDPKITEALMGEIQAAIDAAHSQKNIAVSVSANELAREYGVHPQTVTAVISRMGLEWDGYAWYVKGTEE